MRPFPDRRHSKAGGVIDRLKTNVLLTNPLKVDRKGTLLMPDEPCILRWMLGFSI